MIPLVALWTGLAAACAGVEDPGDLPGTENEPEIVEPVETARIRTAEGVRDVGFRRTGDGYVIFDGDILVKEPEFEAARVDAGSRRGAITALGSERWPGGVIPFEIAADLPEKSRVTQAIEHWHQMTSFRFVKRKGHASFVRFVPDTRCSSEVGRTGGVQLIRLDPSCNRGSIIHEIGHTIGFFHEQSRADRDSYVAINWDCVEEGHEHNFETYESGDDVGPYDYGSVMHYARGDFANGSCDTIIPTVPTAVIGQRSALSVGDILAAHRVRFGIRPAAHAVPADYDGDGRADLALKDDLGVWRIDFAAGGFGAWDVTVRGYGDESGVAVPADYDGDGRADLSVKGADGKWYIDYASNGFGGWNEIRPGYGGPGSDVVPADYDGDGRADLSIKGADGTWLIDYASNGFGAWNEIRPGYGGPGSDVVPADYDGDGKADLSIKGADGTWFIDHASNGFGAWNEIRPGYGGPGSDVVPADYDGDGRADLSIKGADGTWFIDHASNGFGAWNEIRHGYGAPGSDVVPADYDGDGKADLSIKEPGGAGIWFIDLASNGFGAWNLFRIVGA